MSCLMKLFRHLEHTQGQEWVAQKIADKWGRVELEDAGFGRDSTQPEAAPD
jgi:hypothetical protein